MDLNELQQEVKRIASLRGWSKEISDKIVHAMTELGEVADAWKKGRPLAIQAEELADLIIGILDLTSAMCPQVDLEAAIKNKIALLEYSDIKKNDYVIVDASGFFSEKRLVFLLKLLQEKELYPKRVILANELYDVFRRRLKEDKELRKETQKQFEEIVGAWEGYYHHFPAIVAWLKSESFVKLLRVFFDRWQPIPAGEFIGYKRESNPFNVKELKRLFGRAGEILYDELESAQRTRCCIICLSRGTRRMILKMRHVLIETPHRKKKELMQRHKWVGYLAFIYVFELSSNTLSTQSVGSFLGDVLQNASPIVRRLFEDSDILALTYSVYPALAPLIDTAIGLASVAILFDSVERPKIVLGRD
jgi:NTP pyrophosphatase (non-canonical NTP hydrolase)